MCYVIKAPEKNKIEKKFSSNGTLRKKLVSHALSFLRNSSEMTSDDNKVPSMQHAHEPCRLVNNRHLKIAAEI